MITKKYNSSIHSINSDKDIGLFLKVVWMLLNYVNNSLFSLKAFNYYIHNFNPNITKADLIRLNPTSSPSRALSDLFWMKIDYEKIHIELEEINVFETGAGSGSLGPKIDSYAGGISSYYGVDSAFNSSWKGLMSKHINTTFRQSNSNSIFESIPKNSNLFITQSAVEHFDDDLLFFHEIKKFIDKGNRNTIQIHLVPSAACLKLYLLHGVRQYNFRSISKIVSIFDNPNSYAALFPLGGKSCNKLHFRYITKPEMLSIKKVNMRDQKTEEYFGLLKSAINFDINTKAIDPSFYALVIHSNFKNDIFNDMKSLNIRSRN